MVFSSAQLRILQLKLRTSFVSQSEREEDKFEKIKGLIREHQFLIEFVGKLNDAIKNIILLEFALESINGATALLQLISVKNAIEIPYATMYLLLLVINLSVIAWSANEIIVQSYNIANAVYESNWMDQSEPMKKLLFILLMRAQKPLSIDVGPFRPMNNEAALMTMKGAYTYANVMMQRRTMNRSGQ
uniref:Odorant receptor 50 n=1 Tax=Eucryptorrhynchus scrobiculatus TaxID=1552824 RepID=A0A8F2FBH1_EUCSC|nr:odorant receptor 50 [Eucryptorrhynchus scrobiculatus]